MNQERIGNFIQECRKNKKLTQSELAEMLGISDRAVSKWERGLNLPDASLMLELSDILGISVTELLSGEIIEKKNIMEKSEERLIEIAKQNEYYARTLLNLEWLIGIGASSTFIGSIFFASFIEMSTSLRAIIIAFGIIVFAIGIYACTVIETKAGYYQCGKCEHKYVPGYIQLLFAPHIGRTRHMRCPECHQKSWSKKVTK